MQFTDDFLQGEEGFSNHLLFPLLEEDDFLFRFALRIKLFMSHLKEGGKTFRKQQVDKLSMVC